MKSTENVYLTTYLAMAKIMVYTHLPLSDL